MQSRTKVMAAATLAAAVALITPIKESEAGTCPTDLGGSGDRTFTVNPGTCIAYGEGNPTAGSIGSGYVLLDKTDEGGNLLEGILSFLPSGVTGTSGTWSFTPNAGYTSYVLALKSGGNDRSPDWGAFSLGSAISGDWAVNPTDLSHADLYARVVPVPAALPLMLGALAGLGLIARRKTGT